MFKKRLGVVLGMLSLSSLLISCGNNSEVNANTGEGFVNVKYEREAGYNITTLKHQETGCSYIIIGDTGGAGIAQMLVEKDGKIAPYCE